MLTRNCGTSRLGQAPASAVTLVEVERLATASPLPAFAPPDAAEDVS
jgi:hypothetical protein